MVSSFTHPLQNSGKFYLHPQNDWQLYPPPPKKKKTTKKQQPVLPKTTSSFTPPSIKRIFLTQNVLLEHHDFLHKGLFSEKDQQGTMYGANVPSRRRVPRGIEPA